MKEIPAIPPTQCASCPGLHWRPLSTAINYLVCIAPIVYMVFQAHPASPVGAQLDSGMGRDTPPKLPPPQSPFSTVEKS
ncbi:hypothetical protein DSO57_1027881 [Entomophthora muscae]|uniref:Uncharacterized protein n=1 Tax=Entomophthora muscae TaxID=34485 RepID=A0ACC2SQZ7_9FUNG|nr:hypothetical protein DSO57_1027881 [Entomophthora muscae]